MQRSSTFRTDISVRFALLPGENTVHAALDCLQATRAACRGATLADCRAYTLEGFAALSGRIRPCHFVTVRWFADEGDDPPLPGGR